jgi:hypothetical protein
VSAPETWACSGEVVASRVGEEVVLVDLRTDEILVLNRTGARIWELVSAGHHLDQVRDRLLQEFTVDSTELDREMNRFIAVLRERGLVTRAGEQASGKPS